MESNAKEYSCKRSMTQCLFEAHFRPHLRYTPIGGQDPTKPLPYSPTDSIQEQVKSSFQTSLANLRTTYLDSYILHSPLHTLDLTVEAWRVLIALQDEGKVHKIGLSNVYDVGLLKALGAERQVQVVQNRWYEGNNWDRDVYKYCRENGIQYQFVGCSCVCV